MTERITPQIARTPEKPFDLKAFLVGLEALTEAQLLEAKKRLNEVLHEKRKVKWEEEREAGTPIVEVAEDRARVVDTEKYESVEEIIKVLKDGGYMVRDTAKEALEVVLESLKEPAEKGVVLADITLRELGFDGDDNEYGHVYERAIGSTVTWKGESYVIEKCKPQDAVAFALSHRSENEYWFRFGTGGIEIPQGYGLALRVSRGEDGKERFDTDPAGDSEDLVDDHWHLILRLRKK